MDEDPLTAALESRITRRRGGSRDPAPVADPGGGKGRLTVIATGSRGDVQPQAALGQRLRRQGWQVRFATHRCFAPLVEAAGLELHPLSGNSQRFFGGPAGRALRERVSDRAAVTDLFERILEPFVRRLLVESFEACRDADVVLYWPLCAIGPTLHEALGTPCFGVATYPAPYCQTRSFPNPFARPLPESLSRAADRLGLGGALNALTWRLGVKSFIRKAVSRWRVETLGLPPLSEREEQDRAERTPHLFGFSPPVLAPPGDWPACWRVTGYWFLDLAGHWRPPAGLREFLATGPPPVTIGFGSMVAEGAAQLTEIMLEAIRRARIRAVLLAGWGGLSRSDLPENTLMVGEVPHDWLFSRSAAVIHHGGSSTTAAGLRAGLPSLVVPFGFDQYLWGRRIARLGAGPEPIPHDALETRRLAEALRRLVSEPGFRRQAEKTALRLRAEDGAGCAAAAIDRYLSQGCEAAEPGGPRP